MSKSIQNATWSCSDFQIDFECNIELQHRFLHSHNIRAFFPRTFSARSCLSYMSTKHLQRNCKTYYSVNYVSKICFGKMSAEICFVNWVSEACRINISRKPLSERISQGRCFRTYVCRRHSHEFSKLSTGFRNPVSQVCPQECHGMSPKSRENVIYKHALRKVWFGYKVSDKARKSVSHNMSL